MNKPEVTYIVAPICDKFLYRFVTTLHKFSEPNSYRLIVVDQIKNGMPNELWQSIKDKVHLYIHPPLHQLGFSKAMNLGTIIALNQGTPLICLANDDIEIINSKWMDGIHKTFDLDPRIVGVCPMSLRHAGFGYGVDYNPEILPYKEEYTDEEYNFLVNGDFSKVDTKLPNTFPRQMKGTVVDGAAFIMPYFKREIFEEVGLLDERFWPGSGEDYCMMARIYAKNKRVVSSSYSWIFHYWSKSKDLFAATELENEYYRPKNKEYFADWEKLYPPELNEGHKPDIWGHYTNEKGEKIPLKRDPLIFVDDLI